MDKKYYIDEDGLIKLVQGISNSIIQHTSGEITFTENEQTEEKILNNPDIISEYNGENEVQVDMKLATSEDILKLFN